MSKRARVVLLALAKRARARGSRSGLLLAGSVEHAPPGSGGRRRRRRVRPSGFDGAALPANLPGARLHAAQTRLSGRLGVACALQRPGGRPRLPLHRRAGRPARCWRSRSAARSTNSRYPVPVLFVSADPAADSPARVSRFLARVSLTGRAQYLTGSPATLRPVWRAYGVVPASAGPAAYAATPRSSCWIRAGSERVSSALNSSPPKGSRTTSCKLAPRGCG